MSKNKKIRSAKSGKVQAEVKPKRTKEEKPSLLFWLLSILVITGICFFPMLKNQLTNWDDEYYVVQNALLRGPDWAGIFSQPVVSNYHPITILTLALNYSMTKL